MFPGSKTVKWFILVSLQSKRVVIASLTWVKSLFFFLDAVTPAHSHDVQQPTPASYPAALRPSPPSVRKFSLPPTSFHGLHKHHVLSVKNFTKKQVRRLSPGLNSLEGFGTPCTVNRQEQFSRFRLWYFDEAFLSKYREVFLSVLAIVIPHLMRSCWKTLPRCFLVY